MTRTSRLWRSLLRAVVALLAVAAVAVLVVAGAWWAALRNLERESTIVQTSHGPVEIAEQGSGPAILLIHGSPGGYDQLLPLARSLAQVGYRTITVSRPGYLRTPLSVGSTWEQQADALAALLDTLDIERASVFGVSGGGPVALQLTLNHSKRVRALVLVAAVSLRYDDDQPELQDAEAFGLVWDLGALLGRASPSSGLGMLGMPDDQRRQLLDDDPAALEAVSYLFQSLGFMHRRRNGYVNDRRQLVQTTVHGHLADISAPVLILHGAEDTSVPPRHAEAVAAQVPRANLELMPGTGHAFFVLRHSWLVSRIEEFLSGVRDPESQQG